MTADFSIEPLAEDAMLLRFGEGIDPATNARVHAAARALRAARLPGVIDVAPAYATLLLRFDPLTWSSDSAQAPHEHLFMAAKKLLIEAAAESTGAGTSAPPRPVDIPVCYGDEFGPDLDAVAAQAGIAPDEVVARHIGAEYSVAMLGFAPGFPYLLGLDPMLHLPRRATPRTRVPAGSVAIGGAQTGIYPRELPGGWHLLGRTPLTLFDPSREQPCSLAPGDHVRFRAIDPVEFARLADHDA